jgi:hypothetical protein
VTGEAIRRPLQSEDILVIDAGPAGLAASACLRHEGLHPRSCPAPVSESFESIGSDTSGRDPFRVGRPHNFNAGEDADAGGECPGNEDVCAPTPRAGVHVRERPYRPGKCMRMLMMLVVVVTVPTFQRRMGMFVLLPRPDMPPDTEAHQRRCQPEQ